MMTMMIVSYILSWVFIIYSLVTAKTDAELWNEDIE
jgi:hypothetical protein